MRILYICLLLLSVQLVWGEERTDNDYTVVAGGKAYKVPNVGDNIGVFLLENLSGAEIRYKSMENPPTQHQWFRYKTNSNDSEPVTVHQDAGSSESWIEVEAGDYGYYVKTAASNHYIWIIDYSRYQPAFNAIRATDDPKIKCTGVLFSADATVPELHYYLPLGTRKAVKRNFRVTAETLKWNETEKSYVADSISEAIGAFPVNERTLPAPFTTTYFTLEIDEIARYFGAPVKLTTPAPYKPVAVEGHIVAEQIDKEGNKGGSENSLGGSAPVEIEFTGHGTDAVVEYLWKVYRKEEYPNKYLARGDGQSYSYTFNYSGDYMVEMEVRNADISCTYKPDPLPVNITESSMTVPNAFSPGTTPGKNDVFKITYQSIIKFKGAIFSRWGVKVFEWNSPDQGWDGKYNGRYVPAGVYYYVIEAEGSEGIKYNKQGAINVLRPKEINDKIKEEELR